MIRPGDYLVSAPADSIPRQTPSNNEFGGGQITAGADFIGEVYVRERQMPMMKLQRLNLEIVMKHSWNTPEAAVFNRSRSIHYMRKQCAPRAAFIMYTK